MIYKRNILRTVTKCINTFTHVFRMFTNSVHPGRSRVFSLTGVYPYRRPYGGGWYGYCNSILCKKYWRKEKHPIATLKVENCGLQVVGVYLERIRFPRKGDCHG